VDAAIVLLSTVASTGGGIEHGHVCGGRSNHRDKDNETSSNLHDEWMIFVGKGRGRKGGGVSWFGREGVKE
jgi:hypothetical protein